MMFFALNKVKNGPKRPQNSPIRAKNQNQTISDDIVIKAQLKMARPTYSSDCTELTGSYSCYEQIVKTQSVGMWG